MHWISVLFEGPSLAEAVQKCAEDLQAGPEPLPPDLIFFFASQYPPSELQSHYLALQRIFPGCLLMGCSAGGVVGDGKEVEHRPAISLTGAWLPGVKLSSFHLDNEQVLPLLDNREKLQSAIGVRPEDQPQFILLPDPFSFDPSSFLKALDENYPASGKIGGLASGGSSPGSNLLFLKDRVYQEGLVGVSLWGDVVMDTLVAQGCRPIGSPMFITKAQGHVLYQLDGKPTLQVLDELFQTLSPEDQKLFQHSLFLGFTMHSHQQEYRAGDFLIRNLAGFLKEEEALAVGAHLTEGQVVQFHLRDKTTSAHDMEAICRRYQMAHGAESQAEGALLFSCLGRGVHLFGQPDHDSNMLKKHLGKIPIGGFFCNGEIGPVHQQTFLHGYTSSFGLFRRKKED